jgi:hypothetical protein
MALLLQGQQQADTPVMNPLAVAAQLVQIPEVETQPPPRGLPSQSVLHRHQLVVRAVQRGAVAARELGWLHLVAPMLGGWPEVGSR